MSHRLSGNATIPAIRSDATRLPQNRRVERPASIAPGTKSILGLAVDDAGSLYVANYGKASVFKLTPRGTTEIVLHSSRPWVPTGVAVSGNDLSVLERFSWKTSTASPTEIRTA